MSSENKEATAKKKLVKGRHASAIKRARQTVKITARNNMIKNRVKTFEKKVAASIQKKDLKEAKKALVILMSEMDRAAQKGIVHFKRTARRIGRLSRAIVQAELGK